MKASVQPSASVGLSGRRVSAPARMGSRARVTPVACSAARTAPRGRSATSHARIARGSAGRQAPGVGCINDHSAFSARRRCSGTSVVALSSRSGQRSSNHSDAGRASGVRDRRRGAADRRRPSSLSGAKRCEGTSVRNALVPWNLRCSKDLGGRRAAWRFCIGMMWRRAPSKAPRNPVLFTPTPRLRPGLVRGSGSPES